MKKLLSLMTVALLSLIVAFSTGCTFFSGDTGDLGGEDQPPLSYLQAENVVINTVLEADRQLKTRPALVREVKNSVVALRGITDGEYNGSYSSGVIVDIDLFDVNDQLLDKANEFYVITCHHCVDSQDAIEVCLVDEKGKNFTDDGYNDAYAFTGRLYGSPSYAGDVRLIGGDKDSDLAVLKLTIGNTAIANSIVEAKIMDVEKYQSEVGEDVVAIGNPSGLLPGTVSAGIISYLGRVETIEDIGALEVMQIDVQTNPGSSGGALFNMYGELVGITNAGNTKYDGLNFAIPLKTEASNQGVISIVSQLLGTATATNYGYVSGRWMLGITVTEVNSKLYIDSLVPSSPAYKAGIREGDYVSKVKKGFRSYTITTLASFDRALTEIKKTAKIGETITIQVNGLSDKVVSIVQYIYNDTGL